MKGVRLLIKAVMKGSQKIVIQRKRVSFSFGSVYELSNR